MKEYEEKGYYTLEDGTRSDKIDKGKNPAAPKRVMNDYMLFNMNFGSEVSADAKDMNERGKLVKKAFENMTSDQKKKLEKIKADAEKLYKKRLAEFEKKGYYITEEGERSDMLPLKLSKYEGAPKNVIDNFSAFKILYKDLVKESLTEEERKSIGNYAKKYKELFEKITKKQEDAVAKYILEDKKRYEKERTEYNEKGYYTLADGTRSIDQKKKPSKEGKKEEEAEATSSKKKGPSKMGRRC